MIDIARVPKRFENRVGETQHQDVLRGLFAQEVVDPIGLTLLEGFANDAI